MRDVRELARMYTVRLTIISVLFIIVAVTGLVIFFKGREVETDNDVQNVQENQEHNEWETEEIQKLPKVNNKVTVMVDPGHGGEDPGTMSGDIYEKDIVFDIAQMVWDYLEEAGVDVILSRADDTFIDKYDRAELANMMNVDLFVSIHCNYLEDNPEVSGIETYYVENAEDGMAFANAVHNQTLAITGADDMYVRTNDFIVIKNTNMPAILIETGYLSNKKDVELLTTTDYKKKMAYGIAAGVVEYANSMN